MIPFPSADFAMISSCSIKAWPWLAAAMLLTAAAPGDTPPTNAKDKLDAPAASAKFEPFAAEEKTSAGSVTIGGRKIDYQAAAGLLIVHPKGWDDVPQDPDADKHGDEHGPKNPTAEAAMSYVAYFAEPKPGQARPLTFIYNGGPGSSTVWLHMGAFGPKRVVTPDDTHAPAAPYPFINNDSSLLDASDLVFVDAPGTGFGRVAGQDKEKAFFGVDQDAYAFAEFVTGFLSKYGRWNSPKYLFGESYGTTRSAVLVNMLETERSIDFNGVILLSQILGFDNSVDEAQFNPGVDLPYELALPTYAATAWYHKKLADTPKDLPSFLDEVEHFALDDYALALEAGAKLDPAKRKTVITALHRYTGLPEAYIDKADLRINGGEFEQTLQDDTGTTTGRLDTRFSGPTMDPLAKEAGYDPQSAAISSAYVSAYNDYVRNVLKFGEGKIFKPEIDLWQHWDFQHQPPGSFRKLSQSANVMPDLASALKYNPNLKVQLNAGYFDLATPFFEGIYEMQHLPMPAKLQANIEYKFYDSGHMVYAHESSLKALHDNVSAFIKGSANLPSE
jgi:carboxypeptidase C (cathepsin A)